MWKRIAATLRCKHLGTILKEFSVFTNLKQVWKSWAASSEFGTYRLCEQRRFRQACASAQSRQNLRCSLMQAVSQEEPSDRKPDPWPLWMAGHAQLKVCHDGMLEDTNSLDGTQLMFMVTVTDNATDAEWPRSLCCCVWEGLPPES